jgi:hypothetical protein
MHQQQAAAAAATATLEQQQPQRVEYNIAYTLRSNSWLLYYSTAVLCDSA